MEEVRSFGYLCPKCGKAVLGSRSVFALQAAAVRTRCGTCLSGDEAAVLLCR